MPSPEEMREILAPEFVLKRWPLLPQLGGAVLAIPLAISKDDFLQPILESYPVDSTFPTFAMLEPDRRRLGIAG
jgi:hypothetical protein